MPGAITQERVTFELVNVSVPLCELIPRGVIIIPAAGHRNLLHGKLVGLEAGSLKQWGFP